jgi:hypothetical protein
MGGCFGWVGVGAGYTHTRTHARTHARTRTHAYTHTHTQTHTHTHTHTPHGWRCWANEQTEAAVQGVTREGLSLHKQAVSMQVFFCLFFVFVRALPFMSKLTACKFFPIILIILLKEYVLPRMMCDVRSVLCGRISGCVSRFVNLWVCFFFLCCLRVCELWNLWNNVYTYKGLDRGLGSGLELCTHETRETMYTHIRI